VNHSATLSIIISAMMATNLQEALLESRIWWRTLRWERVPLVRWASERNHSSVPRL